MWTDLDKLDSTKKESAQNGRKGEFNDKDTCLGMKSPIETILLLSVESLVIQTVPAFIALVTAFQLPKQLIR